METFWTIVATISATALGLAVGMLVASSILLRRRVAGARRLLEQAEQDLARFEKAQALNQTHFERIQHLRRKLAWLREAGAPAEEVESALAELDEISESVIGLERDGKRISAEANRIIRQARRTLRFVEAIGNVSLSRSERRP